MQDLKSKPGASSFLFKQNARLTGTFTSRPLDGFPLQYCPRAPGKTRESYGCRTWPLALQVVEPWGWAPTWGSQCAASQVAAEEGCAALNLG